MKKIISKNFELSEDFAVYCYTHPEERFWQALRNWASVDKVLILRQPSYYDDAADTFYFEGKTN